MANIFERLLEIIYEEKDAFNTLVDADNTLGLNVTSDDIISFLEFTNIPKLLKYPIVGNNILTEGDILSILKIIHDLIHYNGLYNLYINDDNIGTITYIVERANKIYNELNLDVQIKIDYSKNYNGYLNKLVNLVGSENFVLTSSIDYPNANKIII